MKNTTDFFTKEMAQGYDERNRKLFQISACMHLLTQLILKNISSQARILCVGAGTGAEILSLSKTFPEWTFVALDPSKSMLEICQERLKNDGVINRCEFIHGYIQDVPSQSKFDAVLSLLVAHFIPRSERLAFFKDMTDRLKKGGYLINAEISFDLNSEEFTSMLRNWEEVQKLMGATPESLATLPKQLKEVLTILPPEQTKAFIRKSGIENPIAFFQALMICGWYGVK